MPVFVVTVAMAEPGLADGGVWVQKPAVAVTNTLRLPDETSWRPAVQANRTALVGQT